MPEINVRVVSGGGQQCNLEIDTAEPVESLMALVEIEMGVPMHHQRLVFSGTTLQAHLTLQAQGLTRDSTIQLSQQASNTTGSPVPSQDGASPQPNRSGPVTAVGSVEDQVAQLFAGAGSGGAAGPAPTGGYTPSTTGNPSIDQQVANLFQQNPGTQVQMRNQLNQMLAQQPPPLDPMDPEYQRKMYEAIQRKNMEENLAQAMEYTPEAFATVVMLYVKATANKHPMVAFVDSGAQMTIMNESTAEKCGLMHLLDRRMQGEARGVGTGKILGRVHMTQVELGGHFLPMSITVMEGKSMKMDFIIGLDQLRRHKMCIDLDKGCLRFGETELPFLGEGELPKEQLEDEGDVLGNAGSGQNEQSTSEASGAVTSGGAPPSAPTDPHLEDKIQRLMQLSGSARAVVIQALDASDGNEDAAANLLFE